MGAGCLNRTGSRQPANDDNRAFRPENLPTEQELDGYPIHDRQAETKEFYVIDPQGIEARQEPHDDSRTIVHFDYGDLVRVFVEPGKMDAALHSEPTLCCTPSSGITPDYYAVGGSVYREWRDDERESTVQCWRDELIFVKRSALGDISQVRLIPEELNEVYEVEEKFGSDERISDERLTVELVDKRVYDSMAMRKVDHFHAGTAPKTDGTLTLETEAGRWCSKTTPMPATTSYTIVTKGHTRRWTSMSYAYNTLTLSVTDSSIKTPARCWISWDFRTSRPTCDIYPYSDGLDHSGVELFQITDEKKIVKIKDSQYLN